MFRRTLASLPEDPVFPRDLRKLGYFVAHDDTIRKQDYPEDFFQFFITNNERYNEVQREAMHGWIRREVLKRLQALGLTLIYLPNLSTTRPRDDAPSLPILITPAKDLAKKKRIIVIFNRRLEDLGIWAYRCVSRESGINGGSAVSFIHEAINCAKAAGEDIPGFILANPGQMLYSHREDDFTGTSKNCTPVSWSALPRPSLLHPPRHVDPKWNTVPGSRTLEEHIQYVMEKVVANGEFVNLNAKLEILGLGDGGDEVLTYLGRKWNQWKDRIAALALTSPVPLIASTCEFPFASDTSFINFLANRTRVWARSPFPLDTALSNPLPADILRKSVGESELVPFHVVSGGELLWSESVIVWARSSILAWFDVVRAEDRNGGYEHPELVIPREVMDVLEAEEVSRNEVPAWGT